MSNGNWFAVDRDVFEHEVVGIHDRPLTEFEAWLWLLAQAEYSSRVVYDQGNKVTLDPGQLLASRTFLAKRWMWTEDKVRWFLKRLGDHEMVARVNTQGHTQGHTRANTQHHTQGKNILSISNYSAYQHVAALAHPGSHPGDHPASPPGSHPQYKDNTSTPKHETPPLPPLADAKGGEPEKAGKRKRTLTAAEVRLSDEAVAAWNKLARQLGFAEVRAVTDPRRRKLLQRLADIGGIDRFKLALSAVERVPFLMGKVPPKPGMAPFRLDIERLLQTDGNLGDVLAKLIDKAGEEPDIVGPNGNRWGWWRGKEAQIRNLPVEYWRSLDAVAKPNGEWPWWSMGAPPGHDECLMPEELTGEKNYVQTYQGKTRHD
jgi:hypothetical protein